MIDRDQKYSAQDCFTYKRKKYLLTQNPKIELFDLINQHLEIYEEKLNDADSLPTDKGARKEFSMLVKSLDSWHLAICRCTVPLDLESYEVNKLISEGNTQHIQSKVNVLSFNQALFLILGLNLKSLDNIDVDVLKNNVIFDPDDGYPLLGISSIYDVIQQTEGYLWLAEAIKLTYIQTDDFIELLLGSGFIEKQGKKVNTDNNQALKDLYQSLYDAELIDGEYQNKWEWIDTGTLLVYLAAELQKTIYTKKIDIRLKMNSVENIKEIIYYKGKRRLSQIKNKAQKNSPRPKNYQKIDDILAKIS